jgi:hypothetical protein
MDQFRDPSIHSCSRPIIKIMMNRRRDMIINILLDDKMMIGAGINNTISMSNTMKITASRKNRVENGIRAEFKGSNPHSNGDVFSRSVFLRMNVNDATIRIIIGSITDTSDDNSNKFMN